MPMSPTSPSVIAVAEALAETGPVTITQLTKHTGLARSTVTGALKALETAGRATRSKGTGTTGTAPAPDTWRIADPGSQPAPTDHNTQEPHETVPAEDPGHGASETDPDAPTEASEPAATEPASTEAPETSPTAADPDPNPTVDTTGKDGRAEVLVIPFPDPAAEAGDRPPPVVIAELGPPQTEPSSDTDGGTAAEQTGPVRLGPGELRAQVEAFFAAHQGHELTAGDVARMLGRSAGAVHNAIQRLITEGKVRQTADNPRRYTAV